MKKIGSLFFLILFFTISLQAKVEVFFRVDDSTVGVSKSFRYSLWIRSDKNNINNVKVADIDWPDGVSFVRSWSGTSFQTQIINGSVSTERIKKIHHELIPHKEGAVVLPSAQVVVDGESYTAQGLKVIVTKKLLKPRSRSKGLFNRFDPFAPFFSTDTDSNVELFIEAQGIPKEVFLNEQIDTSWFLYTTGTLQGIQSLKPPSLNHFYKHAINLPSFRAEGVAHKGKSYRRYLLTKHILFPLKQEELKIKPFVAQVSLLSPASFGFSSRSKTISSSPDQIRVKPLPLTGRSSSFSGAVGQFQISAQVKTQNIKTNEPFVYKILFQGRGSTHNFSIGHLSWPKEIQIYDVQEKHQFFDSGTSQKEIEVLLLSQKSGKVLLPSFSFSAFDPQKAQYYTLDTGSYPISISLSSSQVLEPVINKKTKKQKPFVWDAPMSLHTSSFWPVTVIGAIAFFVASLLFFLLRAFWLERRSKGLSINEKREQEIRFLKDHHKKGQYRKVARGLLNLIYQVIAVKYNKNVNIKELKDLVKCLPVEKQEQWKDALIKNLEFCQNIAFGKKISIEKQFPLSKLYEIVNLIKNI